MKLKVCTDCGAYIKDDRWADISHIRYRRVMCQGCYENAGLGAGLMKVRKIPPPGFVSAHRVSSSHRVALAYKHYAELYTLSERKVNRANVFAVTKTRINNYDNATEIEGLLPRGIIVV